MLPCVFSFITYVTAGLTGDAELCEMSQVDSHCGQSGAWCGKVFCAVLCCDVAVLCCDVAVAILCCFVPAYLHRHGTLLMSEVFWDMTVPASLGPVNEGVMMT
jgi:hypothetical protein